MFKKLKSVIYGSPRLTKTEQAKGYQLNDKPFTQALLFRGCHYHDDAINNHENQYGSINDLNEDKTLEGLVAGCAITIAHDTTVKALTNINRPLFLPGEPIPDDANIIVAFSLLILNCIYIQLKCEEIELNLRQLAPNTTSLFFLFHHLSHSKEEIDEYRLKCLNTFDYICSNYNLVNVKELLDGLFKLITWYIRQWTLDDKNAKEIDLIPLFGGYLSSLLSSHEGSSP